MKKIGRIILILLLGSSINAFAGVDVKIVGDEGVIETIFEDMVINKSNRNELLRTLEFIGADISDVICEPASMGASGFLGAPGRPAQCSQSATLKTSTASMSFVFAKIDTEDPEVYKNSVTSIDVLVSGSIAEHKGVISGRGTIVKLPKSLDSFLNKVTSFEFISINLSNNEEITFEMKCFTSCSAKYDAGLGIPIVSIF